MNLPTDQWRLYNNRGVKKKRFVSENCPETEENKEGRIEKSLLFPEEALSV
jgi:hypothetical protein